MLAVAVAHDPGAYSGGELPPDAEPGIQESAWAMPHGAPFYGAVFQTNPRALVEPWTRDMLTLWRLYRGGEIRADFVGMGAAGLVRGRLVGHLPEAGGAGEQAAIMLEAFAIMNAAEDALNARR